jgi:endonuclease/exonuclease/phosphatase family metal-dependent hydrolase
MSLNIKCVSLNLWLGGVLMPDIVRFLGEQSADVVLLQEAYNGTDETLESQYRSVQVLGEALGYEHTDFVPDFRDFERCNGLAERGNAVLSRFPVVGRSATYFDTPYSQTYRDVPGQYAVCPRDLQYVALMTPGGLLHVYNIQGVWDLDGDNYSIQRRRMSDCVLAAIADKTNVLLAGDTNAKPTNEAIVRIERYLTSVFGQSLVSTFNMKRKDNPGYATAAVDMMFVSPEIEVLEANCPSVDISDHLPLVATVRLP